MFSTLRGKEFWLAILRSVVDRFHLTPNPLSVQGEGATLHDVFLKLT